MNIKFSSIKRELKWFAWTFGVPFAILIGFDLFFRRSPLTVWERLTRPEDICAYGTCIILPAAIYLLVTIARVVLALAR